MEVVCKLECTIWLNLYIVTRLLAAFSTNRCGVMVPRTSNIDTITSNFLAHFEESCELNIRYSWPPCISSLDTLGKIHVTTPYGIFLPWGDYYIEFNVVIGVRFP